MSPSGRYDDWEEDLDGEVYGFDSELDDDLDDESEYDEDGDGDDAGDEPTVVCPDCGADVYEESERCPECGHYITDEELTATAPKPWWIAVGAAVCLYLVYRWTVG